MVLFNTPYTTKSARTAIPGSPIITHLTQIDVTKLITNNERDLWNLIDQVEQFRRDVGMSFEIDKSPINGVGKSVWQQFENYIATDHSHNTITFVNRIEVYKYLEMQQSVGIDYKKMKPKLLNTYTNISIYYQKRKCQVVI